jgi:tricorn protease
MVMRIMNARSCSIAAFAFALSFGTAAAQETRLLRTPAVSRELVAFAYAGDLWVVPRAGGTARRLTSTPTVEALPRFSPDGSRIAFAATVGGNTDVYVVQTAGGEPTRLTFHPGVDQPQGWTPDGRRVLFRSDRDTPPHSYFRLWTIGADGGMPDPLALPRAFTGAYSPDTQRVAYEEFSVAMFPGWAMNQTSQWRHYRGGRTHPIRLIDLSDHSVEKLPWSNSNDTDPMWLGSSVYFISDRNHTANLFAYDVTTKAIRQLTQHDDFDIMSASAGPDAIVYEQAGYIHLLDTNTRTSRRLNIQVRGDLPWARPQFRRVAEMIRSASLSPTGTRAVFEARGDIFTVPAEKGDYRDLTRTPGVHDRYPVWSPDGTRIAWLSDASGEYQLVLGEPLGLTEPKAVKLPARAFFSAPSWSPDGKHIMLSDNVRNLWLLEVASGRATKVDTDTFEDPGRLFDAVWAPDSRWLAYSKSLDNHLRAIFVYSLETGRTHQLSDGLSDATSPAFDAGGKYVYFLASTNYGPRTGWLEMSSVDRPATRALYVAVLSASDPSPLLPELGDEPAPGAAAAAPRPARDAAVTVRFDPERISQRILALNVPPGDYSRLEAGAAGSIFYLETLPGTGTGMRLHRYRLAERAAAPFLDGTVRTYALSGDRSKLLYRNAAGGAGQWGIVGTERPARVGDGAINVAQLEMRVEPAAEWAQIFRETWRLQRDYFYDAEMHGADWQAVLRKYEPLVAHVGHRADLAYLIATVGGELAVGHSYITGGGDQPADPPVSVGMLGADFVVENGRYRIRRIYTGENWNPELRAPLSAPGIDVAEGDYVLEVNGRPLTPPNNLYSLFEGTAERQTALRVSRTPGGEGARLVVVVPVASEAGLRTRAWIEDNRRRVDELSGGRLAYVWLPNTGGPGYTSFNRYYFAQQHRDGAIIDERYNQGGMVADYIVNELDRKIMGYFAQRTAKPSPSPAAGLYGPKVMIVNESAGSGGDALPYYFKLRQIGPLVGTRTWGALVGTLGLPSTIDGGGITAPSLAFYDLNGEWAVENEGVAPDIEVEYDPAEVMKGRDPQLERAVQEAMRLLRQNPPLRVPRPQPINRVKPVRADGGEENLP